MPARAQVVAAHVLLTIATATAATLLVEAFMACNTHR
jgi:hypothetical protein